MANCTCETTSSWGCPMHAPKHMAAGKPNANSRPEASVGGSVLDCSVGEFQHRCQRWIAEEQCKINPDNALIALICDAVRLSREYMSDRKKPIETLSYREGVIAGAQGAASDATAAKLWREVAPLLRAWDQHMHAMSAEIMLGAWCQTHRKDLEAADAE